jgi:hypothetical protein
MTSSDTFWTLQTAIAYGGGFMRRLADAGLHADPGNRQRLLRAFPELSACYGPQTFLHRQARGNA